MTPEGKVVAAIKKAVKLMGGETRKMQWVGHSGAPDLCLLFPGLGVHMLVEVKAPGQKPKPHQSREMAKLWQAGFMVWVVDDVFDFLWQLYENNQGHWDDVLSRLAFHAYKEMGGGE